VEVQEASPPVTMHDDSDYIKCIIIKLLIDLLLRATVLQIPMYI
jgi:hypothetical protein